MYIIKNYLKLFIFVIFCLIKINVSVADVKLSIENDSAFIVISGEIVDGDSERFSKLITSIKSLVKNGYVVLDSPGGKVVEAIAIGTQLRSEGFFTAVMEEADCQSACALIWLAGNKRIATSTSRIGFHQTYTFNQSGNAIPSIQGNALVGYYLAKIDVNASVVSYVTAASPETFEWLSFSKAKELGIDVVALNDVEQTTMGRVEVPIQPEIKKSPSQPIARLPLKKPDEIPSYKNIQRAVKNTMNKYKKDGIFGLRISSLACWKRVSELGTAKSFQYCFSLDMISAYIDNIISTDTGSKRYNFFTNDNLINRQANAQTLVKDKANIPNDFVRKWGRIAVAETNKLAANR